MSASSLQSLNPIQEVAMMSRWTLFVSRYRRSASVMNKVHHRVSTFTHINHPVYVLYDTRECTGETGLTKAL